MDNDDLSGCLGSLIYLVFYIACIAAWINHVIVCVREDHYLLLFGGILIPPIGVVHGFGAWFGWW